MRFWQGMLLGVAVGLTGVVLYNRSNGSTKAMINRRAKEATEMIGSAAKAMSMNPMMNNR